MCGRFSRNQEKQRLFLRFKASESFAGEADPEVYRPRYNFAPSHIGPVVVSDDFRHIRPMKWGLVPSWAGDAAVGQKMINARAETLAEKPSFRQLLFTRRCLIPATGFYEWAATGKARTPMHFRLKSGGLFGFAGLWDRWQPPGRAGRELETFTIITTTPNDRLAGVHDRMPAILGAEDEDRWLDPKLRHQGALLAMLKPYPAGEMEGYEVGRAVNSPLYDAPECAAPLDDSIHPPAPLTLQRRLF